MQGGGCISRYAGVCVCISGYAREGGAYRDMQGGAYRDMNHKMQKVLLWRRDG